MSGNVSEWLDSNWGNYASPYKSPAFTGNKCVRGGGKSSLSTNANDYRCLNRTDQDPAAAFGTLGFRFFRAAQE